MRSSETQSKLYADLVVALGRMEGVVKDAENDGFKKNGKGSGYATLGACIEASRDILAENHLAVVQGPGATNTDAKTLTVTTRIIHASGEWIESDFEMPLTKWSPHEAGSATTYGRRFALMAMLGLSPMDDDGNAASHVAQTPRKAPGAIETGEQPPRDRGPSEPGGKDFWKCAGVEGLNANQAKKEKLDDVHEQMRSELDRISTAQAWTEWCNNNLEDIRRMPLSWRMILRAEAEERGVELGVFAKP